MSPTIKLYGHLREEIGCQTLEANVFSIREAVDFLTCNWPKLKSQILSNNYHVLVDDKDVDEDYLYNPLGNSVISFIPVVEGTGNFGKILSGAALIGLAFGFPFALPGVGGSLQLSSGFAKGFGFASANFLSKSAFYLGSFLLLNGVSGLLTSPPDIPEEEQRPQSTSFSTPLNTSVPGVAIPLAYGTILLGSIVINTNVVIGDLPEVQD